MNNIKNRKSFLGALCGSLLLAGCGLLDVDNPNALVQADFEKITAAAAAVNGSQATVARGVGSIYASFSTVGDEITWIGSRDAWNELDQGKPDNTGNEFVDGSFPSIAQARWMSNSVVTLMEGHLAEQPGDPSLTADLARANLYAGVAYSTIAQLFDDFAFSDRTEPGPLLGPDGMRGVFDEAISYFTAAMANGGMTATRAQAARAQAYHQRAIWDMLNPAGSAPANPLVSDASANSDAEAVLASIGGTDWAYRFAYSNSTVSNNLAFQVNERGELQIGPDYVTRNNKDEITGHILMDPIEGALDVRYKARVDEFLANGEFSPLTVVSERGLRLILAEAALAGGNEAGFAEAINMVRAMDDLTPYSGQVPAMDMLQHERRVNLFLQFKRLQDHYRFGAPSSNWLSGSVAETTPGTMLPITRVEILANCHHPQNPNHPCSG